MIRLEGLLLPRRRRNIGRRHGPHAATPAGPRRRLHCGAPPPRTRLRHPIPPPRAELSLLGGAAAPAGAVASAPRRHRRFPVHGSGARTRALRMRREQRRKLLFAIPVRLPLPLPSLTGAPSLGGGADARYPSMVRLARRLWADAEAESGIRVLTPTALLSLGPRSISSVLAAIENAGVEEVDLAARWGGAFRAPDCWIAAASERGSGILHASKSVEMFQALAVKKGAVVRDNAEVVDIRKAPEGGVVVKTRAGEEFTGAKCVVTVGAWTGKLLLSVAGVDLPIQPLHTLVLYWRIKPGHERALTAEAGFPTFSSYCDPHFVYSTPSLERPGMIKINYHGGPPCDPDSRDLASGGGDVEERVAQWIEEFMPGRVETAGGPVERVPCMYSMTPDEDFVIDFLGGEFGEDVVIGAGFSGHGFKMGPAVGCILAEMAMDGEARTAAEAGVELGHFRISRFDGNPMGNAKDL